MDLKTPTPPNPCKHTPEQLNSWQRIFVFILIVGVTCGYDIVAIYTGVIGTYDDEGWKTAAIVGVAFLLVFRPEQLAWVVDAMRDFLPGRQSK